MDTYNRHSFGQSNVEEPMYPSVAQVGTEAPDFILADMDGRRVHLSEFRGKKHVVLEFGNIT